MAGKTADCHPPSLADQALAVWSVDASGMRARRDAERGGLDYLEFSRALSAARVTLNLIAATPHLRTQVEAEITRQKAAKRAAGGAR
jgi:hypothetical protein